LRILANKIRIMMTVSQVAERLNCSPSLVYELLRQGRLPFIRIGTGAQGGKRVREEDLSQFIEGNRVAEHSGAPPPRVKLKHLEL
jgi:excisionase family DNA binding protein